LGWVWHDFGGPSEFREGGLKLPTPSSVRHWCNEMVLLVASVCACTDTDRALCSWESFKSTQFENSGWSYYSIYKIYEFCMLTNKTFKSVICCYPRNYWTNNTFQNMCATNCRKWGSISMNLLCRNWSICVTYTF